MDDLERLSAHVYNAYFVDLFVRASNTLAINMYEQFGYVKYRRVLGYYSSMMEEEKELNGSSEEGLMLGMEDAWDMRKALGRDEKKQSMIPLDHPIYPEDLEW